MGFKPTMPSLLGHVIRSSRQTTEEERGKNRRGRKIEEPARFTKNEGELVGDRCLSENWGLKTIRQGWGNGKRPKRKKRRLEKAQKNPKKSTGIRQTDSVTYFSACKIKSLTASRRGTSQTFTRRALGGNKERPK